jgi:hypothetical protein
VRATPSLWLRGMGQLNSGMVEFSDDDARGK